MGQCEPLSLSTNTGCFCGGDLVVRMVDAGKMVRTK